MGDANGTSAEIIATLGKEEFLLHSYSIFGDIYFSKPKKTKELQKFDCFFEETTNRIFFETK